MLDQGRFKAILLDGLDHGNYGKLDVAQIPLSGITVNANYGKLGVTQIPLSSPMILSVGVSSIECFRISALALAFV